MTNLVAEANERAKEYDWVGAIGVCRQALEKIEPNNNPAELAGLTKLLARFHFKTAFSSGQREEFEESMRAAKSSYERACSLYAKAGLEAASKTSAARGLFATFWITRDIEKKRKIVNECIALSTEAARIFTLEREDSSLAETNLDLLGFHQSALNLAGDWESSIGHFEKALQAGRNSVKQFDAHAEDGGLLEALHQTLMLLTVEAEPILDPSVFLALKSEIETLNGQLSQLSGRLRSAQARCLAKMGAGNVAMNLEGDFSKAQLLFEEALSAGKAINDSYLPGLVYFHILQTSLWRGVSEENAERRRQVFENGIEVASRAVSSFEISLSTTYLASTYASWADCHFDLANLVETEVGRKRVNLEKAIELATKGAAYETGTWGWRQAAHVLGKAVHSLAITEAGSTQKKDLLQRALSVRQETLKVTDILRPPYSWDRCVMLNYLALVKSEQAKMEENSEVKVRILRGAAADIETCLSVGARWATNPGFRGRLAQYGEWYGDILFQLYGITLEPELAEKAVKTYKEAEKHLGRTEHPGRTAPIEWKIARVRDAQADYKQAAASFQRAAENYELVADSLSGAKTTFDGLSKYMKAWSRIETARLHHAEGEFTLAAELYADAAKILQGAATWMYLSKLSLARSFLETGEALSRRESFKKSTQSFVKAQDTFREAKNELEKKLQEGQSGPEQEELKSWVEIAESREGYSLGRLELEEAKTLDRKGDKKRSYEKYDSASNSFRELVLQVENPQDRDELNTLSQFCQALARMKEAEAKSSPELFAQAAESFIRISNLTSIGKFRLLALANACICHALEFGTQFRLTKDVQFYAKVKTQLEAATEYYQEGGLKKAASWTRGTQRLFDSLLYLADAESEGDPKKKTEYYHIAEKHLERAAALYGKAGFPSKKDEALGFLRRAREDRDLLLVSLETLGQMPGASGDAIAPAALAGAQALGLERFEEANVIGNLTVQEKDVHVGSDFVFEVELANVGTAPATLVRLENVVPDSFEILREMNPYRWEDGSIDLGGKRLGHLKMHEMRIILRPVAKGAFELRPRVFFADDKGNYRWHNFGPVELTVGELGLSGWLRGPGGWGKRKETVKGVTVAEPPSPLPTVGVMPTVEIPSGFQFETERSKEVFHFLVREFVKDYMARRIYSEKAGWRSMMDVIRALKLPRSALYGAGGGSGPALSELERRGLIERRVFPEERGRGGDITKVRVAFGNAIVKDLVERAVMENP